MLTFSNYDADATELFEFLRWKNLARQQEILKATMVSRCLQGLAPEYLYSRFTWRDPAYDLRDSENKLNVLLPRTNYYRKSFSLQWRHIMEQSTMRYNEHRVSGGI